MRHPSITLTMDTWGHLSPGQEVEAVRRLGQMLDRPQNQPPTLRARGTDHHVAKPLNCALQLAQQSGRENVPLPAKRCDSTGKGEHQRKTPKPLQIAGLSDMSPVIATGCESSSGGIRTPDTRIMIPLL